jgi:hypothetical protein
MWYNWLALFMARQLVKAAVSLAVTRERNKPGAAIAKRAMTIANTIIISIKVKPDFLFFISIGVILSYYSGLVKKNKKGKAQKRFALFSINLLQIN